MKKLLLILSCLFLLPAAGNPLFAQPQIDTDKLDAFFTSLSENDRFMGSVAIFRGEDLIYSAAHGIIDEEGTPAGIETVYRIGSITKSFTSAMIMQLIEEEKLSLDSKLAEFFPSMPNADRITIKQLIQHRSGLVNFTDLPDYMEYHTRAKSRDELLAHFEQIGTNFEPGEAQAYSNTAYLLLGFIIEEITGHSYAKALEELITGPAGLQSTYFGKPINTASGESKSFNYSNGEWTVSDETDMSIPHAAGAIVSTATETALFYRLLFEGNLLSDSSLEKMTDFDGMFGLGLLRFPFHEKTAIGHNGGIDGFRSNAAYFPDDGISYAITASAINYSFNDILIGLLSITFGREYEIPDFSPAETIEMSAEQLDQYTGTFTSPGFPMDIRIFTENGKVYGQATGQGAFELTVVSETRMIFEAAGIVLEFDEPENSQFKAFTFSQGGMSFVFSLREE